MTEKVLIKREPTQFRTPPPPKKKKKKHHINATNTINKVSNARYFGALNSNIFSFHKKTLNHDESWFLDWDSSFAKTYLPAIPHTYLSYSFPFLWSLAIISYTYYFRFVFLHQKQTSHSFPEFHNTLYKLKF